MNGWIDSVEKIDWPSKPEGATHYSFETEDWHFTWWKEVDGILCPYWVCNREWNVGDSQHQATAVEIIKIEDWDSEKLPSVGTKCLYAITDPENPNYTKHWYECEVRYVVPHSGVVAYCHTCGCDVEQWLSIETTVFKPIPVKSKEEIEKEKAIAAILKDIEQIWVCSDQDMAEALYELGYKKGEQCGKL